ncbi:MAG: hypothetical protein ACUVR7_10335, partial [Armatimonadota bacterium]
MAQETLPRYSHPKNPHHFTLPQLTACVVLMFYLDISYRDMEEWLLASEQVCRVLELRRIPDHTTLQHTYKKLRLADLEKMERRLLDESGVEEEQIASDSTGFSPGRAKPILSDPYGAGISALGERGVCRVHGLAAHLGLAFGLGVGQRCGVSVW